MRKKCPPYQQFTVIDQIVKMGSELHECCQYFIIRFVLLLGFGWLCQKFFCGNPKSGERLLRYPPGPWNIPFVGYMPFLVINPYKRLENLGRKYGSIFTIFLGRYRVVVLNDYNVIREAFKEDAFCGRPDLKMLEVRNDGIRKGLVCSEGKTWTDQRKFTLRHLKDLGFGKQPMETLIREELSELIQGIRNNVGKPINLLTRFQLAVLNALWKITCGERYRHEDNRLLDILNKTGANFYGHYPNVCYVVHNQDNYDFCRDLADTQYTGPLLFLPWLLKIAPVMTRWSTFVNSIATVHHFLKGIIDAHKRKFDKDKMKDFIDHYLAEIWRTTDKNSSFYGELGEHSLLVTLLDLFMAGADTTSTTLYWAFLYMVLHENVQLKVQQEIDHVLGKLAPTIEHRKRMPYTEATIKEVLRKSSLVPLGLFHSATENTKLFGYDIPKETVVISNLHNCHNNRQYWTDPENFRPERFIGCDNTAVKYDAFLPFSTGKRVCPGESLARDELFLFFVGMLQQFTFQADPTKRKPFDSPKIGIVLSPHPFNVVVSERG